MKKLILIALIALSTISCKKETALKATSTNVTFKFSPHGNSSTILITDLKTGSVKKYENQIELLTIDTIVSIGDRLQPEMIGEANGGDENYNISVYCNGNLIAKDRAFGAGVRHQDIKIPLTFIASYFK